MPASGSARSPLRQSDTPQGAGTWQSMVAGNQALLLRKTGQDMHSWVEQARAAGIRSDAELRDWMRDGFGVTGYAQYAVSWEMFGYPDFMLRDAAVDVALRLEGAAEGRLEQVRTRPDDPFTLRVRLTSPNRWTTGSWASWRKRWPKTAEPAGLPCPVRGSASGSPETPSEPEPLPRTRDAPANRNGQIRYASASSASSKSSSSSNSTAATISRVSGLIMKASSSSSTMRKSPWSVVKCQARVFSPSWT